MAAAGQDETSSETAAVSEFIAGALSTSLPDEVAAKSSLHILDTIAAMVSGASLEPGRLAIDYVRSQGGLEEAQVIGGGFQSNATLAAFANAMSAHADETDDSHAPSFSHPGCGVVPAALAVAERHERSGTDLLRAVSVGYDIGTRISPALGISQSTHGNSLSSHAIVSLYGAAAAAAALEGLGSEQVRWVLSYTAQQTSGVTPWLRDERHVQKAFVFAGMGARNGVAAATMVAAGLDGVGDIFSGHPNALESLSSAPSLEAMSDGLGERHELMRTNIKKYAVGSPAQAAVQAIEDLIDREGLTAADVVRIEVHLPADLAGIVDSRHMPDINCQYLVAGTLLDARFSFEMAHDSARMQAPDVRDLVSRISLLPDESTRGSRQGKVIVHRREGTVASQVTEVRGTADNPMDETEVMDKCRDLLIPSLGAESSEQLIEAILHLEKVEDVRALRPLLEAGEPRR